jgi:hypothetical protein
MVVPVRLIICALIAFVAPTSALGENSVEEAVFEDCDTARHLFSQATPEEKKKTFDFLCRVITLNTQAPGVPEPFAQLPGQQRPGDPIVPGVGHGADVASGSLWQTMDAKRELNGKRCAVSIFALAGASALSSLPKLTEISCRENLSDEIAVALEETTASIAEQAHRAGINPSDSDIATVTPLLTSERPLVARNYLHEYVGLTLPHVTKYLSMIDGADGEKVLEFLRDVDPDGSRGMRAFLDLLVSLPDEQQQRLGRQIPLPSKQALPGFISEFARLAADSAKTNTFMPILGKSCVVLDGLTVDSTLAQSLSQRSSFDSLEVAEQRCLIRSIPALSKRVSLMLSSTSSQQQLQAIELLASAPKSFTSEQKSALWSVVRERALASDPEIQKAALRALVTASDKKGEPAAVIIQILKNTFTPQSENQRLLRQQALDSLTTLAYSKDLSKLVPPALAALSEDLNPGGPIAFLARADDAEAELLRLAQQGPAETRRRSLEALADRAAISPKVVPVVVPLLDIPEIAALAERVLTKVSSPQLMPLIRRALLRSTGNSRTALLALLQLGGSATKSESAELVNLLNGAGCSQLADRSVVVQKLLARKDVDTGSQSALRAKCDECLSQLPDSTVKALLQATPAVLSPNFRSLSEKGLSDESQESLLGLALESPSAQPDISSVALSFIESGSRPARIMLLSSPRIKDAASAEVIKAIHKLLDDSKNDDELRLAAVRALITINDSTFDWRDFVKHSITEMGHNGDHRALRDVLRLLPTALVLDEVSAALNSDNQDKIIGACRVGAALGAQAVPIVSKVWSLREHRAPAVRYSAILALLEINPLTPDLQEHLKRLLVNRYYPWALREPIPWRNTVAVVDLNAASFGTLRTVRLEELLQKQ